MNEYHINKINFVEAIKHIPTGQGFQIIFEDDECFDRFLQMCHTIPWEKKFIKEEKAKEMFPDRVNDD